MFLLITLQWMGCAPPAGETFAIYRLEDEVPAVGLTTIGRNDLALQGKPVLSSGDVVAYSWEGHEIDLTAQAYERIQQLFSLPVKVNGMPFVVCVERDRIYAGASWTPLSSLSFNGIVICQPFAPDERIISLQLGYPCPEASTGHDPRSDPRIEQALRAAGKLRE
jgi:hypothetical protein